MKQRVLVLSGPTSVGKSTLAEQIVNRTKAIYYESGALIVQRSTSLLRAPKSLESASRRLDQDTGGTWLADAIGRSLGNPVTDGLIVVDSVHSLLQVLGLRSGGWQVVHVHLDGTDEILRKRYRQRPTDKRPKPTFDQAAKKWPKKDIQELSNAADVVIDTDRCSQEDVFTRVLARLEVRPITATPLIDVLVGGQYGSEGKGNIAHHLAPEYDVLVRVGGPNAGHKVFRPGQDPYTFRQVPSGALGNPNAILVLGAGAVIGLNTLLREIQDLALSVDNLYIDGQAMIIEDGDVWWEKENLEKEIGSTAQGIGSATARKILYRKPKTNVRLARDIPELKHHIQNTVEFFADCMSNGKKILLEGTQGTSLSLHHGHYPHVTSRATTAAACLAEAGLSQRHVRRVLMVCRTYPIRVGNTITHQTSGFMSNETTFREIAKRSGVPFKEIKGTEVGSVSGRQRRIAEFDWAQLRRSLLLNGPTDIALTFADYLGIDNRAAYRYEQLNDDTLRFIEEIEKVSGVPVSMISTAFNDRNIIDRRTW